jgi:YidC/Oxa1 family membrane protein insertase
MLNVLVLLYGALFSNYGVAIILFTVLVRLATLPLTLKQMKQMKAMTALQPRMRAIQKKYEKNPQKRSQETMRLYREAGVSPLGCLGPLIIQLPIWIGLYRALIKSLGTTPDHIVGLSQRLYSWNPLNDGLVPLNSNFLWLNLANPDPTLIMAILVGVTTWAQQKMTTMPTTDPRQSSQNTMMLWMMPIFLAVLTLTFPSGLALYWIVSNIIGVFTQYFITGDWGPLLRKATRAPEPAEEAIVEQLPEESENDGREDNGGENRRRSHRASTERARGKSRRSRSRNS